MAPSFWFITALVPMVASQLVRIHLADPAAWIFWDYAGRIGALAVPAAIPSARLVACLTHGVPLFESLHQVPLPNFARVELAEPEPPAAPLGLIEITLPDGARVRVDTKVDERTLRRVLRVLRER